MAKTKVSKLIRVKAGRNTVEFELGEDRRLTIETAIRGGDGTKVIISEEAVNVLREMLGLGGGPTKLATQLPTDTEEVPADSDKGPDFKAGMA